MPLKIYEPIVSYGDEIEMLSDPICAGTGWDQCDAHGAMNLGRVLIPHPANSFIAHVTGESMIGAGVQEGDYLVINRLLTPHDGCIVAVSYNGGTLVKRLHLGNDGEIILQSANKLFRDIDITEHSSFVILGVVTSWSRLLV